MQSSQALVPHYLSKFDNKTWANVIAVVTGVLLLSALAQIAIPLPWTPVPLSGQTLGVTLIALSWGRKRAFAVLLGYLALGAAGLPVFAMGRAGLLIGPTFGYLMGMALSSLVVGTLADLGFTNSFKKSLLAAFVGSALVFTCGLIGLSFFIPKATLLAAGLLPFIPGDIVKNLLAASASWKLKHQS